jgi:hypothetical protein
MTAATDAGTTRAHYDEFACGYERHRRPNDPHGYHAMVDDLGVPGPAHHRALRSPRLLQACVEHRVRGARVAERAADLRDGELPRLIDAKRYPDGTWCSFGDVEAPLRRVRRNVAAADVGIAVAIRD